MLKLDSQDTVGQTAYWGDDHDPLQYYALPGEPTLAIRDGKPVFKYIKYRVPIDRPGGIKGGGLVVMQAELALPAKDEAEIRRRIEERLRARGFPANQASNVRLGRPLITRGKVTVAVMGETGNLLVQRVVVPSPPSLFGNNAVSIGIELNEIGAPVFEAGLKSPGASLVIVGYELGYSAKLPAAHLIGTWDASAFQHFSQSIQEDSHWYSDDDYEEKIVDSLHKSDSQLIRWIDQPPAAGMDATQHQKMLDNIEDSVRRQLDEAIKRNVLEAIPPESRDVEKIRERGFEDIVRNIDTTRSASVRVEYMAEKVVEMPANPNAPLPGFGSIVVDGKALKWDDYAITIDADDPFFKSFAAAFMVNADFADLPIASVIVQVSYKGKTGDGRAETYTFRKPEDIERFEAFLDGGTGEFDYSYVVNYRGESNVYQSPPLKSKSDVSINVGDLGIWKVDIDVGDINFEEVSQAQLKCTYKDGDVNVERQFTITPDATKHQIRQVIFKPRSQPWKYTLKYFMKGGREVTVAEATAEGEQLYVNDPFTTMRTISVRTKGDFDNVIDTIFLDFAYDDPVNNYSQSKSFSFSKAGKRFEDWSFPVFDEKQGTLKYSGNIVYRDGRPPRTIPDTPVTSNTVLEGEDVLQMKVEIVPDLLDWTVLKLATVTLSYADPANGIEASKTFTLRKDATPSTWIVDIKNKALKSYSVAPRYFMADGTRKEPTPFTASDDVLVLEVGA
ncbi:MAG: hypothetical protein ACOH2H_25370 [Cypionkella sp.]